MQTTTQPASITALEELSKKLNNRSLAPEERIRQAIEQLGEDKTLKALDRQLAIEEEITRTGATDGPLKSWAEHHALLSYHGIDSELEAIASQLFSFGTLLEDAKGLNDDVIMTGVREMLCSISHQIRDIAGGKLPYDLLPTQIKAED